MKRGGWAKEVDYTTYAGWEDAAPIQYIHFYDAKIPFILSILKVEGKLEL